MLPKKQKDATSVIAAAAGLATSTIAIAADGAMKTLSTAAADAVKTLSAAATISAKVVSDTAERALAEFPRLQDDIREIRMAQQAESGMTTEMVKALLIAHTSTEEEKLKSIDASLIEVKAHLVKQNGRLAKAETHITRQNLVLFGIAGPVSLLIIGYYVHAWVALLLGTLHTVS